MRATRLSAAALAGIIVLFHASAVSGACSAYNGHLNIAQAVSFTQQNVCVFLAVKACPGGAVIGMTNFNAYGSNSALANKTGGAFGNWLTGGTTSMTVFTDTQGTSVSPPYTLSDLTGNVWKLYQDYPGTFFSLLSNYNIAMNGASSSYYWDGPLAGGTGLIRTGSLAATATGVTGAPSQSLVLCTAYVHNTLGSSSVI